MGKSRRTMRAFGGVHRQLLHWALVMVLLCCAMPRGCAAFDPSEEAEASTASVKGKGSNKASSSAASNTSSNVSNVSQSFKGNRTKGVQEDAVSVSPSNISLPSPAMQALNFSHAPLVKPEERQLFLSQLTRSKQAKSLKGNSPSEQPADWKQNPNDATLNARANFGSSGAASSPASTYTWYSAGCLSTNNLTKCGAPPSGRSGHSATRVGNKLVVYGGCYLDA